MTGIDVPSLYLPPQYKPFEERTPDAQYAGVLDTILSRGILGPTHQGIDCLTFLDLTMYYPFANGFPVIPDRSIGKFWRKPIAELLVFMLGGHTLEELEAAGVTWWREWLTPEKAAKRGLKLGDLGPGSYGYAFKRYPTPDSEDGFDQIQNLIWTLLDHPYDRRALVTTWIPNRVARNRNVQPQVTIAPCHGTTIYARILGEKLQLTMSQRSGDTPVGVPSNIVQYAAFTLMLAQLIGREPWQYNHHLIDAHLYVNQLGHVRELLARDPRPLPTVQLSEEGRKVTQLMDFKPEHFILTDYDPHPPILGIPVAS